MSRSTPRAAVDHGQPAADAGSGRFATIRRAMSDPSRQSARARRAGRHGIPDARRSRAGRDLTPPVPGDEVERRRRTRSRCRPAPTVEGERRAPAARRAATSTSRSGARGGRRGRRRRRAPSAARRGAGPGARARSRARAAYVASVCVVPAPRGRCPRHRAAGVLAVDALEPDLVAGEDHRHAGQRELQPGGDPVRRRRSRPTSADPGAVVGAEDVPARARSPRASRSAPCHSRRLDARRRRRDAGPAPGGRRRAPATPGRAATTTRARRSRSSSSCRASRRRRGRRWRRGCARR